MSWPVRSGYRELTIGTPALVSSGTPYPEKSESRQSRLDDILLNAWCRVSPYLRSKRRDRQTDFIVQCSQNQEKRLTVVSDEQLRRNPEELRTRLMTNHSYELTASAFALASEAASRHTGMRAFPVQLRGGAVMMSGAIAEMQTGEGKSLTALLPAIAAGLMGLPVHIVTVNEYLARRDADLFRCVYQALGLSVGLVEHGQSSQAKRQAYACDITYCTNKELVFDYLRDRLALGARRARARRLVHELFEKNLRSEPATVLLRGLHFAIVDEADSILVDEARIPLILSGTQGGDEGDDGLYEVAVDIARRLTRGADYHVLTNERTIRLTPEGERRVAELTAGLEGLWTIRRAREELIQQALSALYLFRRDVQYIVSEGKVQIVDEYTGRVMPDRSWEAGLHQLIEVKENCTITRRHHTIARITYQRFFRRYIHLCGMTGTAIETAGELGAVYGLRVSRIPTNRPLQRTNLGTRMFSTAEQKGNAVVESAKVVVRNNRAVLIGTRSVGASEHVGQLLHKAGMRAVVLNARQDRQEAQIVAAAGQPGRVTVATNMAGRGTDIKLHPAVSEAGGLHVILTEFHEARRIDRQLFGSEAPRARGTLLQNFYIAIVVLKLL
jgi:preprotein translocase subunit SecA